MAYTIETMGRIGDPVKRFVACVYLGPGNKRTPRTPWRAERSFDLARADVLYMQESAQLFEPMYSGWVLLDGPNDTPPILRATAPAPTAWRIW